MVFNTGEIPQPIPSILEQVEEAIIQRLAPLKELGIAVIGFPNDHREIGRPYPNGVVLVAYDKSEFKNPDSTDLIRQEAYQCWYLSIGLKNLRTNRGAFSVMKAILILLTGFRPPHCGPIFVVKEQFVRIEQNSKIWEYVVEVKCRFYNVQSYESEALGLLKSASFNFEVLPEAIDESFSVSPISAASVVNSNINNSAESTVNFYELIFTN